MEMDGKKKTSWDCGSPLYDAFELASVYRVLDSHLMALPYPARDDGGRAALDADVAVAAAAAGGGRRTAAVARRVNWRRRAAARRTGKAVLHSICRTVTCSRKL